MKKNLTVILLSVAALVLSGYAVFRAPVKVVTPGANPGPEKTETQYFYGGFENGGAGTETKKYVTTATWSPGSIAAGATSSTSFALSKAGTQSKLPAVGDACYVGNELASTTLPESYSFKVTAVDSTTASGTLTYRNLGGTAIVYGSATLNVFCSN